MKKTKIPIIAALAFSLVTTLFSAPVRAQSPLRGLRVDPGYFYNLYPGLGAAQVAEQVVGQAKASGVNTLFVYAYNSVYGALYPTTYKFTTVEGGYGKLNILKELTVTAAANGLKVVAVVPVSNFKAAWEQNPAWRAKMKNGADYLPAADTHLLSAWHPAFRSWLAGFYNDLLLRNPGLDGIEAVEPFVDYRWRKEADYNPVANEQFRARHPAAVAGDQSWLDFRADGLTGLISVLTTAAAQAGKKSYLVQTWPAKPDGTLFSAQVIKDNIGLDLDAVLNFTGPAKLNYLMGEFMWQQWAAEHGPANFPVEWTRRAAQSFIDYVGPRSTPLIHVEMSRFDGAFASVTPTPEEFSATLRSVESLNVGIDVYDFHQVAAANAWDHLLAWNPAPAPPRERIYGVTLDSIARLPQIVKALKSLNRRPTARIVFDENMPASYYRKAAAQIHAVSGVMGEILDSFYVKTLSTAAYSARVTEYLNTLGDTVDIWEIGNEINGEWLGDTPTVTAKIHAAYDLVKARGKKTALTLYYNEKCWAKPDHEVFTWAQKNISTAMKEGLDYVFLSYYEDDCNGLQPDWPRVFQKLGVMFPNSSIGFGEVGTKKKKHKAAYIHRYYTMPIDHPNFVGGYFWWYFAQDMVPMTKPLWNNLNTAIQQGE